MPFHGWTLRAKGFSPPTPFFAHGPSAGQFDITPATYLPYVKYIAKTDGGVAATNATISGNRVTLPTSGTEHARVHGNLGLDSEKSSRIERRTKTQYQVPVWIQTGFQTMGAPCPVGWTCYGTCGPGGSCGKGQGYTTQQWQPTPTPGGFTDSAGEWWKIDNGI